jgi:hypothetical protein
MDGKFVLIKIEFSDNLFKKGFSLISLHRCSTLQTISHLCNPKKDLAKPHFLISTKYLQIFVSNFDIL